MFLHVVFHVYNARLMLTSFYIHMKSNKCCDQIEVNSSLGLVTEQITRKWSTCYSLGFSITIKKLRGNAKERMFGNSVSHEKIPSIEWERHTYRFPFLTRNATGSLNTIFTLEKKHIIYYLFIYLIQYLSRGIQVSKASLNGALTQHKNKDIKTLKTWQIIKLWRQYVQQELLFKMAL